MNLFQLGDFRLASGQSNIFKIDCDALTKQDLAACARMLYARLPDFCEVRGVPEGGLRLAEAMEKYASKDSKTQLIVDDVWTTGGSITSYCKLHKYQPQVAAVIFARNALPYWCVSLFKLTPEVNMGRL